MEVQLAAEEANEPQEDAPAAEQPQASQTPATLSAGILTRRLLRDYLNQRDNTTLTLRDITAEVFQNHISKSDVEAHIREQLALHKRIIKKMTNPINRQRGIFYVQNLHTTKTARDQSRRAVI